MNRNRILLIFVALIIVLPIAYFLFFNKQKKNEDPIVIAPTDNVKNLNIAVKGIIPHDTSAFTEGLEIYNNKILEGTGTLENTFISLVDTNGGNRQVKVKVPKIFGEGVSVLNGKLYQLTYTEAKVIQYNATTFTKEKEFPFKGEGWGLTNDGKNLIASNGSENILFLNPTDLQIVKTLPIQNSYGLQREINELEYVDGFIYANIFQSDKIIKIDATTGKIVAEADASFLRKLEQNQPETNVLNGIAYDKATKLFYVTGKNWAKTYKISFGE
jgi:glutaminyl-peptide cyclotransferase